jgi:uncharacterized protein YcbX
MNDLELQDIFIYPIKSLGGISVQEAEVQPTGLQYDRQWMLIDKAGIFMSQRTYSAMALLQVSLTAGGMMITHKHNLLTPLPIPFATTTGKEITVNIWDDVCIAIEVSAIAGEWFSDALKMQVQLVYMPAAAQRLVDTNYADNKEIVSFADAYPFMMIGQSSLDDLNSRLSKPVLMNRFRPNFVFKGGTPYCEDAINIFCIGDITFTAVKPCARCVLTTIDQEQAVKGAEPLKTLSAYRTNKNKVLFGQNLLHTNTGKIKVGDKVIIRQLKK